MAGEFLPAAQITASGRPVLKSGEFECFLCSEVDLLSEEFPAFPHLKSGLLILTTHRLLWLPPDASAHKNSSYFIPLSSIQHILSTKKSIKSMFHSPRIRFQVSATPEGRVSEKGGPKSFVIMLIVRGKADVDSFVGKLWDAWRGRAWEASGSASAEDAEGSSSGSLAIRPPVVGVAGILRKEQEMWESTDKSLQDAFQDLNALMSKAKEMVMLAEKMRSKLLSGTNNQGSETNDDEMGTKEEMQDWLLSVGIVSPVTKESAGALYHQQLSRQLADFIKIPLERAGGMINLIDIYCLFNRARGTELISPDDLLQACSLWDKFDVSVMLRKFDSGVMVIQSKSHSDDEVFARIGSLMMRPEALLNGISPSDAAMTLGVAPAMAKEYLLAAEGKGLLCRDVSPDGFRFYANWFPEINSEDIYFVKEHSRYSMWIRAVSSR
ncbi:vacuolar protein sorting-associated protein 36 [Andrographis paniculata]|uniref:vacuolar protein sorting-associated protein 36 n=1 Tax=Andrographis paniculata TaxID=175694 RepID=UPI0021E79B27|nr:vacuolar protein sorting-associated protein 36 [Andrographis paniculata]